MNWNDGSEDYNKIYDLKQERKKILAEIAKYLSPGNQNVVNGDIIASLRDVQQIRVSAQGLADEAHKAIERLADILWPDGKAGETYSWSKVILAVESVVSRMRKAERALADRKTGN